MLILSLCFALGHAFGAEVSLGNFLETAWKKSPSLSGQTLSGEAANHYVSAARAKYLPHVSVDAIDSTGFAASNSRLDVSGIVGSPYRSGFSAAVVVEQTLYDFGRIEASLKAAQADRILIEARAADEKMRFLVEAGRIYLRCASARSNQAFIERLLRWADILARESARFTRTGQRSIVDNSLVEAEVDNLRVESQLLAAARDSAKAQMRLLGADIECEELVRAGRPTLSETLRVTEPSQLLARAQIEVARAELDGHRANQRPKLNAMGSAGYMERSRLVDRKDYAAGIALNFPIWNGDEDRRREQGAKSKVAFQAEQLKGATLAFRVRLNQIRDEYRARSASVEQLAQNLSRVEKTIEVAAKRYQTLQGTLIDVREAFRQLRDVGQLHLNTQLAVATQGLELGLLKD